MSEFRTVKISMDGEKIDLKVKKSETILDAALENDIDLPYSCLLYTSDAADDP